MDISNPRATLTFYSKPIENGQSVNNESVRVLYPGFRGSPVMAQQSGYDQFPLVANSWGTIQPKPDMPLHPPAPG
jgi:hypothetical protein